MKSVYEIGREKTRNIGVLRAIKAYEAEGEKNQNHLRLLNATKETWEGKCSLNCTMLKKNISRRSKLG